MPERFTEAIVEDAALPWLGSLGYAVKCGLEARTPALHRLLVDGATVEYCTCTELRGLLLPKLISRGLRIRDAQCVVEAVP
jgi:hypothetical protein